MQRSYLWAFIIGVFLLGSCSLRGSVSAAERITPNSSGFAAWVKDFNEEASKAGISSATRIEALGGLQFNPKVLERDAYQPEFVKPVWGYLETAVSPTRVRNGRTKFASHKTLLREVTEKYQVPPQLITAIWGLETAYGATFGGYNVVEALATLGYAGRRQDYWRQELMSALRIIDHGDIAAGGMIGSWAGAMGHTQFMPSSYQTRAVDYNGNGKRDIWNEMGDVFASTSNFMNKAGWRPEESWGAAVKLPANFDWALADRSVQKTVADWAALGVKPVSGKQLPSSTGEAWILLPAGHRGPAFIVLPNFRAIMRYNNSTSYALAIGLLSDRIAGAREQRFNWPTNLQALTREQRKELQSLLTAKGFDTQGIDGILGSNSRNALRAWQLQNGLVPDAFATVEQLELLRKGA